MNIKAAMNSGSRKKAKKTQKGGHNDFFHDFSPLIKSTA
jgi:hypothetical protein